MDPINILERVKRLVDQVTELDAERSLDDLENLPSLHKPFADLEWHELDAISIARQQIVKDQYAQMRNLLVQILDADRVLPEPKRLPSRQKQHLIGIVEQTIQMHQTCVLLPSGYKDQLVINRKRVDEVSDLVLEHQLKAVDIISSSIFSPGLIRKRLGNFIPVDARVPLRSENPIPFSIITSPAFANFAQGKGVKIRSDMADLVSHAMGARSAINILRNDTRNGAVTGDHEFCTRLADLEAAHEKLGGESTQWADVRDYLEDQWNCAVLRFDKTLSEINTLQLLLIDTDKNSPTSAEKLEMIATRADSVEKLTLFKTPTSYPTSCYTGIVHKLMEDASAAWALELAKFNVDQMVKSAKTLRNQLH